MIKLKRCFYTLSAIFILGLCFSADVIAQDLGSILYVSPSRVIISPDQKIQTLTVSNRSGIERRYDISVVDQIMNEQGITSRVDTFDYSAKRMLRFVPKRFSLKPNERQIIRVMVRRPDALPDGDYHSHMLFREIPTQNKSPEDVEQQTPGSAAATFEIKTLYGLAVPVVVQNGVVQSDMVLADAKILKNADGPVLAIAMQRSGNAEASRYVTADKILSDGSRVPVMPGQWVRMYREVEQVNKLLKMQATQGSLSAGDNIEIRVAKAMPGRPELEVVQKKMLVF